MQAEARDFNRLANAIDVLGRYQGLVGGARKAWAEQNRDTVIGYTRASSEVVDWLYDASNKEEALLILMGIEALAPQPGTSQAAPGHKIYPYLLRKLALTRSKAWCRYAI